MNFQEKQAKSMRQFKKEKKKEVNPNENKKSSFGK